MVNASTGVVFATRRNSFDGQIWDEVLALVVSGGAGAIRLQRGMNEAQDSAAHA